MLKELSSVTKSILTYLNNADELITYSNKRREAKDVIRSLRAFAKERNYALPEEKIDNFFAVLLDSRQHTLSWLLTDIAQTVVKNQ